MVSMSPKIMGNIPRILLMGKNKTGIMNRRSGIPEPRNANTDILIVFSCSDDYDIILMSKTEP